MKIYLSGPISGRPGNNAAAFKAIASGRRAQGYEVVSPIEMDQKDPIKSGRWGDYLGRDLQILKDGQFDAMEMLTGWEQSAGSNIEKAYGEFLGLQIFFETTIGPLESAAPLVHRDRQDVYGHPAEDFARTAGIWRALFGWPATPKDVPLAMIAVKLSRLRQSPHHKDSATDVAGYIEAYHMTLERNP